MAVFASTGRKTLPKVKGQDKSMISSETMSFTHGILQTIAFLVVLPIGALIAILRRQIGEGWLKYHVAFQLTGVAIVFIAGGIQLYKWHLQRKNAPKDAEAPPTKRKLSPKILIHIILGSLVSLVLIVQLFWAFLGRRYFEWMTWYYVHVALSSFIIAGGVTNLWIGWSFH